MKRLLIPLLLLSCNSFAAGIQKWVDEDGQVHYGDSPPAKVKSESIKVSRPPSNPGKPLPKFNPTDEAEAGDENAANQPPATESELPVDEAQKVCDQAQKDLSVLQRSDTVRVRTPDGGQRVMSQEEVQQRREQAEQDIDRYCQ